MPDYPGWPWELRSEFMYFALSDGIAIKAYRNEEWI